MVHAPGSALQATRAAADACRQTTDLRDAPLYNRRQQLEPLSMFSARHRVVAHMAPVCECPSRHLLAQAEGHRAYQWMCLHGDRFI